MKSVMSAVAVWLAAVWWGSMTAVGFYVVPMLFAHLPTPAMAGNMAAKLFSAQNVMALVCGLLLLLNNRLNRPPALMDKAQTATIYIVSGMLLALLSEFAVAPRIMARENLRLWHSVGTVMYLLQWACAGLTFQRVLSVGDRANSFASLK